MHRVHPVFRNITTVCVYVCVCVCVVLVSTSSNQQRKHTSNEYQ